MNYHSKINLNNTNLNHTKQTVVTKPETEKQYQKNQTRRSKLHQAVPNLTIESMIDLIKLNQAMPTHSKPIKIELCHSKQKLTKQKYAKQIKT